MAKRRNFISRLPLAPVFGLLFGTAVAVVIAVAPQWRFEQAIDATGLSSMLSVARPPLGLKARLLAIALGFALVAILVWLSVAAVERLLAPPVARGSRPDDIGRDDAGHDDALDLAEFADVPAPVDVPRRPIFADRELGAPLMSDEALTRVVAPLAPEPSPLVDVATGVTPSSLNAPLDLTEFDVVVPPEEPALLAGESSIEALIRRLEAGLARRAGPPTPPPSGSADQLGVMRDMMALNREREVRDQGTSMRVLDSLRMMSARRLAR